MENQNKPTEALKSAKAGEQSQSPSSIRQEGTSSKGKVQQNQGQNEHQKKK